MPQSLEQIQSRKELQAQFLEELKACRGDITAASFRVGVNRSTFYIWQKRYKKFKEWAENILGEERAKMNDYAESKLFKLIDEGNIAAVIFFLKCKHPEYQLQHLLTLTNKWEVEGKLSSEDRALIEKAINYGIGKIKNENIDRPELSQGAGE
jgi:L-lactate utilization protein LutC